MTTTAADVLVDTLMDWGVDTVFGLPGDGINGIMESLRTRQDRIRFIQVRHEESAAFMACAYAKFTGRLGVCLATSGPGAIHLLNGLYDAKLDGQPVLALTGAPFHDLINTFTQQDVNADRIFEDVALYNVRVMGPAHVENVIHLACRSALGHRGVAHVTMPVDMQSLPAKKDVWSGRNVPHHVNAYFARSGGAPRQDEVRRAADILNRGERVAILAGRGALHASDELEAVAEKIGAPIVKALLGKAVVPDDSPYTTGCHGLLGTRPSQDAIEQCDTLLMVGTSFPYGEFMPKPGQAEAVQIDIDPQKIGLRYPVDAVLVGDARRSLQELLPLLDRKEDRSFLEQAQRGMEDWWELMADRGTRPETPMKPQVTAWELSKRLRSDAIVTSDSGTIATWFARQMKVKRGQMYSLSGTLATMATGLPYAIAAAIAHPGRQVVAYVGDGGLSMLMGELATVARYKLDIKVVVVKNNTLGQIKWEQMVFLGNPEYGVELQPIDFAGVARACGLESYTVEDPDEMGPTYDAAFARRGPALIEAVVDPFEPPHPPKISVEQAAKFAESLVRGEPNRMRIAWTALSDQVRELI